MSPKAANQFLLIGNDIRAFYFVHKFVHFSNVLTAILHTFFTLNYIDFQKLRTKNEET